MKNTDSSNNDSKNGYKKISPYALLGIVVHETLEKILKPYIGKLIHADFRISNRVLYSIAEEILEVEEKWVCEIRPGFMLTLLPDLILESPEKELVVVDWKTQKDLKSDVNDSQLGIYKLLAERKYSAEDIQTVIAYTSRIQWSKPWYSHSFTSELESNIVEEIELWKSRNIEDFPASPHPQNCSSCPQLTRCEESLVLVESFID